MSLFRSIRRWWMRLRHKHQYEVIWRTEYNHQVVYRDSLGKRVRRVRNKFPAVLERCSCCHERFRYYDHGWHELDMDFIDDFIERNKIHIPARHPE